MIGDETWVQYNNSRPKMQWLSPNESPQSTPKLGLHPKKALLCVWCSIRGVIHFEVLKTGQTVNAYLLLQTIKLSKPIIT